MNTIPVVKRNQSGNCWLATSHQRQTMAMPFGCEPRRGGVRLSVFLRFWGVRGGMAGRLAAGVNGRDALGGRDGHPAPCRRKDDFDPAAFSCQLSSHAQDRRQRPAPFRHRRHQMRTPSRLDQPKSPYPDYQFFAPRTSPIISEDRSCQYAYADPTHSTSCAYGQEWLFNAGLFRRSS